jgi:hypothetical protein
MRGTLPPRYWRKVVAATQGVVLVFAAAEVVPPSLMAAALIASLALLVESFGRDVGWLWNHRLVASGLAAQAVARQYDTAAYPFEQRRAQPTGAAIP